MNRRQVLAVLASGTAGFAGCGGQSSDPTTVGTATAGPPRTSSRTATQRRHPDRIYVDAAASPGVGDGSRENPLARFQEALNAVEPGQTVVALPGRHDEPVETRRAGRPDAPITVTGPPDAVFCADGPFQINHDHVHLRGLTFDGLHDPSSPEDPDAYSESLIQVNESFYERVKSGEWETEPVPDERYLTGAVVSPHAVGNCRADFVKVHWSRNVDIGGFRVIGPAGVKFLKGDADGHNSEIVYLGNAPSKGWPPDRTRNVRVHHIDNSAGHPHAELVDCKTGTSDVTIEYCTDAGGATEAVTDDNTGSALHIGGTRVTVRWNVLSGGAAAGIEIDSDVAATGDPPAAYAAGGSDNAIYGNRLRDNAGRAVSLPYRNEGQGQADQRTICGNEYTGATHGTPDAACPSWVPADDGLGHTGGDSPWA